MGKNKRRTVSRDAKEERKGRKDGQNSEEEDIDITRGKERKSQG